MKRDMIKLIFTMLVWTILLPLSAYAGNIRLGHLKIEPSIGYEVGYNDNIYTSNSNKQNDSIHKIKPEIKVKYEKNSGNYVNAGIRSDFAMYARHSDNNYQAYNPYLSFGIKTPAGFYLRANDEYLNTEDPYGSENQYNLGTRTRRWNNSGKIAIGYEFARRYGIEGAYENYLQRFYEDEDQWQDRSDFRYSASFFYNLSPKTAVFAQYRNTVARYDGQNDGIGGWNSGNSQDYKLNDYFVGARFKPGGKLSGEIKVGYGQKSFKNQFDKDGYAYTGGNTWIAESRLDYQIQEKTMLSLNFQRGYKGSSFADSASYLDTLAGLELRQQLLSDRLTLNIGADFETNEYSNEDPTLPDRKFVLYSFRSGVEWKIRQWLRAGLEYRYRQRNAGDAYYEAYEYDNNIVTLSVNAMF